MPLIAHMLLILTGFLMPAAGSAAAETSIDRAEILQTTVSMVMETGRHYDVEVRVKNVGTSTWTAASGHVLASQSTVWGSNRIAVGKKESVAPGETGIFRFKVRAPSSPGNYPFQWQMQRKNQQWFGDKTAAMEIVVEGQINRSRFVSQVVPSIMEAGKEYEVIIQFRNAGKTTWSGINNYALGSREPAGKRHWQPTPVLLASDKFIAPGETATLSFLVKAPTQAGDYDFQWQMQHQADKWFGEKTPMQRIKVIPAKVVKAAEFVIQTIPGLITEGPPFSIIKLGDQFPVKVVFKNTSTDTWNAGNLTLVSKMPDRNLTWMIDTVSPSLDGPVRPGEFIAFEFKANAPVIPGIYDFQWQLHLDERGFIGDPTPLVKITIK